MKLLKIVSLVAFIVGLSGCISSKSYVDPGFSEASYDDIVAVSEKHDVVISVEFQRNGKAFDRVDKELLGHVQRTLRATGVIKPSVGESPVTLKVVSNNIADIGEAAAKGFGTGLTFGAAGSLVTDYYEFTIIFKDAAGSELTKNYKHALHTTIGNKKAPFDNVEATTLADAFGTVVEQVLLNFIKDMQASGLLTLETHGLSDFS